MYKGTTISGALLKKRIMELKQLTREEQLFCELYATGDAPFAGNPSRCYQEAFSCGERGARRKALALLTREEIKKCLSELEELSNEEAKSMKEFLTQNLKNIVSECSTQVYRDRKGLALSPAPLRSVAVSASKALMEMYPVKEAQVSKLSIDGAGEGGITFNVIMPDKPKQELETE